MDPLLGKKQPPEQEIKGIPLFCVQAFDKVSRRKVFVNFRCSPDVVPPEGDITDVKLTELLARSLYDRSVDYQIPMQSTPMFWTKEKEKGVRNYGIYIIINELFALGRVISSEVMKNYLIPVSLTVIESKYNVDATAKKNGHFLGHKLDFEFAYSKNIVSSQNIPLSPEMVNNKILVLEDQKDTLPAATPDEPSSPSYDLLYRPSSRILTCSLKVEKLPNSISFNDDHLVVKLGDKNIVDAYLPFFIDISEPVKYKHDDRAGLFRVVFKIVESR